MRSVEVPCEADHHSNGRDDQRAGIDRDSVDFNDCPHRPETLDLQMRRVDVDVAVGVAAQRDAERARCRGNGST